MNLADAIRLAAQQRAAENPEVPMMQDNNSPSEQPQPSVEPEAVPKAFAPEAADEPSVPKASRKAKAVASPANNPATRNTHGIEFGPSGPPQEPSQGLGIGQVVRLELYLSPEQLKGLFSAIVGSQHTILTVREAAAYLRIQPSTLEQMADEGSVPALSIDGRWRFPKAGLDEWLVLESFHNGGERNVA